MAVAGEKRAILSSRGPADSNGKHDNDSDHSCCNSAPSLLPAKTDFVRALRTMLGRRVGSDGVVAVAGEKRAILRSRGSAEIC